MDILLIAGLWLDGSAWDDVVPELEALGHRPVPITLPGQGDGAPSATLDDQVAAVLAAVDAAPGSPWWWGTRPPAPWPGWPPTRGPERVGRGRADRRLPVRRREAYADFFELEGRRDALPGLGAVRGPGLRRPRRGARRSLAAAAIPVPEGVARGMVRLTDERRFDVPVVLVCPEFSPAQAQEWIDAGDVPELAKAGSSTSSTSTPATGRCSPGRPSWPGSSTDPPGGRA